MEFGRAVAEIETDNVQPADGNHVAQQFHVVAAGAQRGNDFGVVADAGKVALGILHYCSLLTMG